MVIKVFQEREKAIEKVEESYERLIKEKDERIKELQERLKEKTKPFGSYGKSLISNTININLWKPLILLRRRGSVNEPEGRKIL